MFLLPVYVNPISLCIANGFLTASGVAAIEGWIATRLNACFKVRPNIYSIAIFIGQFKSVIC